MILRSFAIGLTNTLQATTFHPIPRQSNHDGQENIKQRQNLDKKSKLRPLSKWWLASSFKISCERRTGCDAISVSDWHKKSNNMKKLKSWVKRKWDTLLRIHKSNQGGVYAKSKLSTCPDKNQINIWLPQLVGAIIQIWEKGKEPTKQHPVLAFGANSWDKLWLFLCQYNRHNDCHCTFDKYPRYRQQRRARYRLL